VPEIGTELSRDSQPGVHDPGDVGGRIADPLDGVGDPQHAGHALGVVGASGREHRGHAEPAEVHGHAVLQPSDLAGELLLVEEDGRVGQVDHELGRVFELDQELLDVPRFLIHAAALPILS
jgi:hypothetical protein